MKIYETTMIRLSSTFLLLTFGAIIASTQTTKSNVFEETLEVFEWGKYTPILVDKSTLDVFNPPKTLLIITPKEVGVYPLLYFAHGFDIPNYEYTQLFNFIASHGIIVVAPLLYFIFPPSHQEEIDDAAKVANWLSSNLNLAKPEDPSMHILPNHVTANFSSFVVSGHSRGGKTAFALALGLTKTTTFETKVSALIALDPVGGLSSWPIKFQTEPYILTNVVNSIDVLVPTMIIGTGLGEICTPREFNHDEFFSESTQGSHFVLTDYGHCDMLNDDIVSTLGRILCGTVKKGSYDDLRRTVAGLIVAFLDAYFGGQPGQYSDILFDPSMAPVKLYPVENKAKPQPCYNAEM